MKRSVEKQRRTDPGSILHPSHPPGRWSQSARPVHRRNCGVRLKVLSRARQTTFSTQSQQADCKTTTSRAVELFGSAASGRYRTVTLWVTRPRTATLRYTSMRTECAQAHLLSWFYTYKIAVSVTRSSPICDPGPVGTPSVLHHCVGGSEPIPGKAAAPPFALAAPSPTVCRSAAMRRGSRLAARSPRPAPPPPVRGDLHPSRRPPRLALELHAWLQTSSRARDLIGRDRLSRLFRRKRQRTTGRKSFRSARHRREQGARAARTASLASPALAAAPVDDAYNDKLA